MTVSDLLTIIGIFIAIVAFLSESDREFIYNKFSFFDKVIVVIFFLYINFLLYFDWWKKHFSFLKIFYQKNYPHPNTWAYLISLLMLSWIVIKIFKSDFPKSKHNQLIKYYNTLLIKKKHIRILNIIEKYHINDIKKKSNNKDSINSYITTNILQNGTFIIETEQLNRFLFSNIIENDSTENLMNKYILTTIPIKTAIINNYNDTPNIIHKAIEKNYKKIDFQKLTDYFINTASNTKNQKEIVPFLNFSLFISKQINKTCDDFDKHFSLIKELVNFIITNNIEIKNISGRYKSLLIGSFECNIHYKKSFEIFLIFFCNYNFISDDEIIDFIDLFVNMDNDTDNKIITIRNKLIIEVCKKTENKSNLKRIYRLFNSKYSDYKGNFSKIINKISNY